MFRARLKKTKKGWDKVISKSFRPRNALPAILALAFLLALCPCALAQEEITDEQAVRILADQGYVSTIAEGSPVGEEAFSELARYPSGKTADGQVILTSVNPDAVRAVKQAGGQIPSASETGGVLSLSLGGEVAATVVAEGAAVEFASAISPILKIDGTNTYLYSADASRAQPSPAGADYVASVQEVDGTDEELVKEATVLYWGFGGQGYMLSRELLRHADSGREIEQMYIGTWAALRWAYGELSASDPKITGNACASWLVNEVWGEASRHISKGSIMLYAPLDSSLAPLMGQAAREGSSSVVPSGPGASGRTGNLRIVLSDATDSRHFLPGAQFTILGSGGFTQTAITNAEGRADFPAVPVDTYIVMEDRAPSGYAPISGPSSFRLEDLGSQTAYQTLELQNAVNEGKLRIVSHITTDQGATLPGGQFRVTDMGTGQVYGPYSADASGNVEVTGIPVGEYKVERLSCPEGYEPNASDPGPWMVGVSSKDLVTGPANGWTVLYVPNDPTSSSFLVHLSEKGSGKPIAGAVFELTTVPGGRQAGYGPTNENGDIVFAGLEPDTVYSLHQVSAPAVYSIPKEGEYRRIRTNVLGREVRVEAENDYIGDMGSILATVTDASGAPVQGVEIRVFDKTSGSYIPKTLATTAEGQVLFENLPSGPYTVFAVSYPDGFEADGAASADADVAQNQVAKVSLLAKQTVLPGRVEVTAVDENNLPVPGARFTLKELAPSGQLKVYREEVAAGGSGKAYFHNVPDGNFLLENSYAPKGYKKASSENPRFVRAAANTVARETFVIENENPDYGKLDVFQYAGRDRKPVEGARFQAFSMKDQRIAATETTSAAGKATFILPEGEYIIRQAYLPVNYSPDTADRYVRIRKGRTSQEVYAAEELGEYGAIEIVNYAENSINPVCGSSFEVFSSDGKTRVSGPKETGADGKATFAALAGGTYIVRQVLPGDGYEANPSEKTVTVEKNQTSTVFFYNIKTPETKGVLSLHIVDAETGAPVPGAVYSLCKGSSRAYGPFASGDDGYIAAEGIEPGSYSLVEEQAPNGYAAQSVREGVSFTKASPKVSKTVAYRKSGYETGRVAVENYDSVSHEAIEGSAFELVAQNGAVAGTAATGRGGTALFNNVQAGSYIVRQKSHPSGYRDNTETFPATVTPDCYCRIEFGNDPAVTSGTVTVHVRDVSDGNAAMGNVEVGLYSSLGIRLRSEFTNIYGSVTFPDVPFGTYTVRQMTRPEGYSAPADQRIYLRTEEASFELFFDNVRRAAQSGTISISAKDAGTGEPLSGFPVAVENEEGERVLTETLSASNGLRTAALPLGSYTVKALSVPEGFSQDGAEAAAEISEEGEDSEAVIPVERLDETQSACISVKARDADGNPLEGAAFAILNEAGQTVTTGRTGAEGIYRSAALAPGIYTVRQVSALPGYQSGGDRQVELLSGTDLEVDFVNLRREQCSIEASIADPSRRHHTAGTGDTVTLIATISGNQALSAARQVQVDAVVDSGLSIIPNRTIRMVVRGNTDTELLVGEDYTASADPATGALSVSMTPAGIAKFAQVPGERIDVMADTTLSDEMASQGRLGQPVPFKAGLTVVDSHGNETRQESNTAEVHTGGAWIRLSAEDTGEPMPGISFKVYRSKEDAEAGTGALVRADGSEYTASTGPDGQALVAPLAYGDSGHPHDAGGTSVYYLVQQDGLQGYSKSAEPIRLAVTAESAAAGPLLIANSRVRLSTGFSVIGSDTGSEIGGAALRLVRGTDPNGTDVVSEWLTSPDDIVRYPLLPGDYTLLQTSAPFGYTTAPAITFRVTETSIDQLTDGVYIPVGNGLIQMTDRKTEAPGNSDGGTGAQGGAGKVTVTFGSDKTGKDTDETTVQLYNGDSGDKLTEWTSKVPYSVDLGPGTYSFTETNREGSSADTTFRVNDDGTVDVKDGDRWVPSGSAINTSTTWKQAAAETVTETDSSASGSDGSAGRTGQSAQTGQTASSSDGSGSGTSATVKTPAVSTTQTTGESNVSTGVLSVAASAALALLAAAAVMAVTRKMKNLG